MSIIEIIALNTIASNQCIMIDAIKDLKNKDE